MQVQFCRFIILSLLSIASACAPQMNSETPPPVALFSSPSSPPQPQPSCLTIGSLAPSVINCPAGSQPPALLASLSGMQFVGYWEGNSDLTQLPHGPTIIIASFGYLDGHAITGADMGGAMTASLINALHQKGVKVILSLGGGGGTFQFDGDTQGFESSVKSLVAQYSYDGIDFDDENEGNHGESLSQRAAHLITLIPAAKNALGPNGIVTISAYGSPDSQQDGTVLQDPTANAALSLVNVMSYAGNDTQTSEGDTSSYAPYISKSKIVLGVDVDGDGGGPPSTAALTEMGNWVRTNGYGGLMMWTIATNASNIQAVASGLGL
jgi:Glycosyl hydrolases family 18